MATTTLNIPLTTVSPGSPITIPSTAVPVGTTAYQLLLDRHAGAQPLFQQPASTVLTLVIEFDDLGDGTWPSKQTITCPGGPDGTNKAGQPITVAGGGSQVPGNPANPARRVRATVSANSAVTVSGTLTLS